MLVASRRGSVADRSATELLVGSESETPTTDLHAGPHEGRALYRTTTGNEVPTMKTILLVDDDEDVLSSVHRVLNNPREGWACHTAHDGAEALAHLATKAIDLLVTDLRMPVMDGVDLLAAVQREYRGLPVIVLSGLSDVRGVAPGAFTDLEVLQKPVSTAKLKKLVALELKRWGNGQTRDVSLASMLQLMRLERKTCMVQVTDGNHWGELQLSEGRVVGARLDDEGEEEGNAEQAVAVMLSWERVSLDVLPAHWSDTHPIVVEPETADELWDTEELGSTPPGPALRDEPPMDPRVLEMKRRATPDTGALALVLAEVATGKIVAHLLPPRLERSLDRELAAASEAIRLHLDMVRDLALEDHLEEISFVTTGLCEVLRPVEDRPDLFLYGLFDRSQFNVAMAGLAVRSLEERVSDLEPAGARVDQEAR